MLVLSSLFMIYSIISLCQNFPRTLGFDYIGAIVGILALLVTVLLGWQIFNVISVEERTKKLVKREISIAKIQLLIAQRDNYFKSYTAEKETVFNISYMIFLNTKDMPTEIKKGVLIGEIYKMREYIDTLLISEKKKNNTKESSEQLKQTLEEYSNHLKLNEDILEVTEFKKYISLEVAKLKEYIDALPNLEQDNVS